MNNTFDKTLESNFNTALKMFSTDFSHNELMSLLKTGDDIQKQIAVLKINNINSKEDASILVSNLVGQDGKIREAVAFKINDLIKNDANVEYFISEQNFEVFLKGIMDINGNICRQVVSLTKISEFRQYLCEHLPKNINDILQTIDGLEDSKQYVVSKYNFQLYWCLEALANIINDIRLEDVKEIIFKISSFTDYTIREKAAKILAKIDNPDFSELKLKLKNDENYYVRRFLSETNNN